MWGFVEGLGVPLDDCYRLLKQKQDHDNLHGLNGLSGNIQIDITDGVGVVFYDGELCHTRLLLEIYIDHLGEIIVMVKSNYSLMNLNLLYKT